MPRKSDWHIKYWKCPGCGRLLRNDGVDKPCCEFVDKRTSAFRGQHTQVKKVKQWQVIDGELVEAGHTFEIVSPPNPALQEDESS